jgi:hypothetical protein
MYTKFLAFLMFLIGLSIVCIPFYLVIYGFYYIITTGSFGGGCFCIVLGFILLRLIKPISIITGKDYKIF